MLIYTDISTSPSFKPPSSPIYAELSTSIIVDLHQDLNLHRRSTLISQPPSSPICDFLPFTILNLQSLPFTFSDLRVKVVVFNNFLFISLIQSHASSVSIYVLWICGLLVFVDLWVSLDLFFNVDLFLRDGSLYWVCRSVLQYRFVFSNFWNLWSLIYLSVEIGSDRCATESDPTRPWFFTVGGGSAILPPDQIRSVPSWAQTWTEPTRGHPYQVGDYRHQ